MKPKLINKKQVLPMLQPGEVAKENKISADFSNALRKNSLYLSKFQLVSKNKISFFHLHVLYGNSFLEKFGLKIKKKKKGRFKLRKYSKIGVRRNRKYSFFIGELKQLKKFTTKLAIIKNRVEINKSLFSKKKRRIITRMLSSLKTYVARVKVYLFYSVSRRYFRLFYSMNKFSFDRTYVKYIFKSRLASPLLIESKRSVAVSKSTEMLGSQPSNIFKKKLKKVSLRRKYNFSYFKKYSYLRRCVSLRYKQILSYFLKKAKNPKFKKRHRFSFKNIYKKGYNFYSNKGNIKSKNDYKFLKKMNKQGFHSKYDKNHIKEYNKSFDYRNTTGYNKSYPNKNEKDRNMTHNFNYNKNYSKNKEKNFHQSTYAKSNQNHVKKDEKLSNQIQKTVYNKTYLKKYEKNYNNVDVIDSRKNQGKSSDINLIDNSKKNINKRNTSNYKLKSNNMQSHLRKPGNNPQGKRSFTTKVSKFGNNSNKSNFKKNFNGNKFRKQFDGSNGVKNSNVSRDSNSSHHFNKKSKWDESKSYNKANWNNSSFYKNHRTISDFNNNKVKRNFKQRRENRMLKTFSSLKKSKKLKFYNLSKIIKFARKKQKKTFLKDKNKKKKFEHSRRNLKFRINYSNVLKKKTYKLYKLKSLQILHTLQKIFLSNNSSKESLVVKVTPLNYLINTELFSECINISSYYQKRLFPRNSHFFFDFLAITSLFCRKLGFQTLFTKGLVTIVNTVYKNTQALFMRYVQALVDMAVESPYSKVCGMKVFFTGRIKGADKASGATMSAGSLSTNTIKIRRDFSFSEAQTVYGTYGLSMLVAYGQKKGDFFILAKKQIDVQNQISKQQNNRPFNKSSFYHQTRNVKPSVVFKKANNRRYIKLVTRLSNRIRFFKFKQRNKVFESRNSFLNKKNVKFVKKKNTKKINTNNILKKKINIKTN